MSNINFNDLMKMLLQMDKKELEENMDKANKILNSKDPNAFFKQMNNNKQD